MEGRMQVYLVTNKVNGKKYVGQTSRRLIDRWRGHQTPLRKQRNSCLYNAIQKYGAENFEVKTLVVVGSKQEMDYYECKLIKAFDTKVPKGYNITDGGEGPSGYKHSEEARKAISRKAMGNKRPLGIKRSEETRRRMSEGMRGRIFSDEHRRNIGLSSLGRKFSEKSRHCMSESQKRVQRETHQIDSLHTLEIASLGGRSAAHLRWHVKRGIVNPKCLLCEESNGR
jgi:group I intron endonuclease